MKKKNIFILVLTLISVLCFAVGCEFKNLDEEVVPEIVFQNMEKESSETCKIGSVYQLKEEVLDTEGNSYRLNAMVETLDGERVGVFENSFSVDDLNGYKITYSAFVNEVEYKFLVNITVEDDLAPSISINKPSFGVAGEVYNIPEVKVSNFAKGELTVSLGKKGEEKAIVEKNSEGGYSFTPSSSGVYELTVTAKKANGTQDEKTVEIYVDNKLEEGEIFYPENPSAKENISFKGDSVTNNVLAWEVKPGDANDENYKLPYVSVTSTGMYWDRISKLVPRMTEEYYSQFNNVEMWLYFDATSPYSQISLFNDHIYTIPSKKWTKIVCPMTDYLNNLTKDPFLPFKFNDKGKPEYTALKEVRLGNIKAFNAENESGDNVLFDIERDGNYVIGGFMSAGGSNIVPSINVGDSNDANYTGAYVSFNATKEDWGRIQYVRTKVLNMNVATNALSMWVNFTSKSSEVQISFFNTDVLTIPANKWVKISLDVKKFMSCKDNLIPWKNHSAWDKGSAITEIKVGKVIAENNDINDELMFSVKEDGSYVYGSYAVGGGSNIKTSIHTGNAEDAIYKGAYVSFVPTKEDWGRIQRITPRKPLNQYAGNMLKMWINITSSAKTAPINFFDNALYAQNIETNKWTQVSLDMKTYKENQSKAFLPFKYVKGWLNITEIKIGDIVVETNEFLKDPNLMFRVKDDTSEVFGAYEAAGEANIKTSLHKGDANDAVYKGAYVKFTPTNTAGKWGRIKKIAPGRTIDNYTQAKLTVWIYIEGGGSHDISFFNKAECKQNITTNKWLSITLDMQKYKENLKAGDNFMPFWSNTKNIKAIRIGDMAAVSEKPEVDENGSVSLLSKDNIVVCDGGGKIPTSTIPVTLVNANEKDPQHLHIDYNGANPALGDGWWTNINLKNNEYLSGGEYNYFVIKVRYNADRSVKIKEEDFQGVKVFNKVQAGSSTNQWITVVVSRNDIMNASSVDDRYTMITSKVMRTTKDKWAHGTIRSIDIAEITAYKNNPNA